MTQHKKDDCLKPVPDDKNDDKPEVYGVTRGKTGLKLNRRAFIGSVGAGLTVSLLGKTAMGSESEVVEKKCEDLKAHNEDVLSVCFSPDGKYLASGSADKTVKLWSIPAGELLRTLKGHSDNVTSVCFSPDRQYLASASQDKTIRLWSAPDGKSLRTLKGHSANVNALVFGPDGKSLYSAGDDQTINIWSAPDWKPIKTLRGHTVGITSLSISPDGKYLASAAGTRQIGIWSLPDGKLVYDVDEPIKRANTNPESQLCVFFSHDGKNLMVFAGGNTLGQMSVPDLKVLKSLSLHDDHTSQFAFALGPDGRYLAVNGLLIDLISSESKTELVRTVKGIYPILSMAFSPDGNYVASGSMHEIILWSVPEGGPNRCLFDPSITQSGTDVKQIRQMGQNRITLPCGSPIPAGSVCVCDCVSRLVTYAEPRTVCICDTVSIPAGTVVPSGSECVCDSIAVGAYVPKGHKKQLKGTICTCNTICTCDSVCSCVGHVVTYHYWHPN